MLAYRVVPMRGPAGNLAATLEIMKMTDTSIFTCSSAKNEARLKQWDFFFSRQDVVPQGWERRGGWRHWGRAACLP